MNELERMLAAMKYRDERTVASGSVADSRYLVRVTRSGGSNRMTASVSDEDGLLSMAQYRLSGSDPDELSVADALGNPLGGGDERMVMARVALDAITILTKATA